MATFFGCTHPQGNEHESPSNYRQISVTSKLLERHFHQLVTAHLSDNHPLANTQWEFQPAKSTVTALLSTTYDWLEEMEAGRDICSVFLNPFILQWLCSYLMNRQQKVVVGEEESETIPVISGCATRIGTWSTFISNLYWWCYQDPIVWRKQASALCWWHVIV